MDYQEMQNNIFATGSIPDGYFGDRQQVGFAFDEASGKTIVVAECGYFAYQTPIALDSREALYLLRNHPSSNATSIKEVACR